MFKVMSLLFSGMHAIDINNFPLQLIKLVHDNLRYFELIERLNLLCRSLTLFYKISSIRRLSAIFLVLNKNNVSKLISMCVEGLSCLDLKRKNIN